nr:EOG090X08TI [Sida crystallina]
MTELDRTKFTRVITVPSVTIASPSVNHGLKVLKKYLLKIEKLKPVGDEGDSRRLLLDPKIFSSFDELNPTEKGKLQELGVTKDNFIEANIDLSYENFKIDDIFRVTLPEGKEGCTSYSRIGHIVHLNLREHLLPYKNLIGQVMMDKLRGVRTVVNKSHVIDSTYRNFQMEMLAGEPNYVAEVKENMCTFKFDFSKVYWNPRLCTEHERIINLLPEAAVLFDVFAGVGPFSVPAAKIRKCRVFANDLNPNSADWLNENVHINKMTQLVKTFNKDGRQFIREDLKEFLLKRPTDPVHVTMNLPALAVEFLDAFLAKVEEILRCSLKGHVMELIDVRSCRSTDGKRREHSEQEMVSIWLEIPLKRIFNFVRLVAVPKEPIAVTLDADDELALDDRSRQ